MPRKSHNKSPHNRGSQVPGKFNNSKIKRRAASKVKKGRSDYQFKKTQKQEELQKKLGEYFQRKQDATNTVSIGKAKALYNKSLSAFSKKNYGRGLYMLLLSSAVLATYVPNAVPGTTGFQGKSVDDTIGYLEYNYDVASNVNDYDWKNDKEVQKVIKELKEKDEKIASQQDDKQRLVSTKDLLLEKLEESNKKDNGGMCDNFPCQIQGGARPRNSLFMGFTPINWQKGNNDPPIEHMLDEIAKGKPPPLYNFKVTNGGAKKKKKNKGTPEEQQPLLSKEEEAAVSAAIKSPFLTRKKASGDKFAKNPPMWARNYLYGRQFDGGEDPGDKVWIVPSKFIDPADPYKPINKLYNLLKKPGVMRGLFIKGHKGEWKLFDDKNKDMGFPFLDDARDTIDKLKIFEIKDKKCFTEKDLNQPQWIKCSDECFNVVNHLIKSEIHSTAFMLRLITNSLLTNNPKARIKFKFNGNIDTDLTGLWKADKDKFELLPLENRKVTPRLIMCFGPSAAGKTFNAKKVLELITKKDDAANVIRRGKQRDPFPSALVAIDGGIAREMSAIYQMVVNKIHSVDNQMSGFSNLVSAGLSFSKSLFSSEPKKRLQEFLQEQCKKNGYTSLYIPTTATGELTGAASLKKAQKISKWEGLNDQKWIGLMIYQHRTHAECPFKHEFKCMGCTESGRKREIGEGKEYSNSAFQMAYDHGEYCIKYAPGGRIKIHNSGGFKHNGKFTTSIVTEYPHGPNKKFLLGDYTKEEWKSNNMVYFKNDKKVCLLAKDLDVPFNRENPQPKSLTEKFFKCMPPNCRKGGSKHTRGKKKKLKSKHKKTKRKR